MRILIVNDDGIFAPGIEALAETAAQLGEVYVVAPDKQCSGMSQKLTLFEEMPVRKQPFPVPVRGAWSVGGTPADCVKLALAVLLDEKPDYVFSGVNDGWNTGFDVRYSGTIGACFESVMNGIPAIAFSAKSRAVLALARQHMPAIARELIEAGQGPDEIWNVNFPGADVFRGILRSRRLAPQQLYNSVFSGRTEDDGTVVYSQKGVPIGPEAAVPGSDIAAVLDGYISIGTIRAGLL